jgi:hypothetical protein
MKTRPLRAGLLVALTGPLLGVLPVIIVLLLAFGSDPAPAARSGLMKLIQAVIVGGYLFGGVPAIVAAALVAYGIAIKGWIDKRLWSYMTVLVGLGLPALFYIAALAMNLMTLPVISYAVLTIFFLLATIFASVILRVLIIRFGWMQKLAQPVWEVF